MHATPVELSPTRLAVKQRRVAVWLALVLVLLALGAVVGVFYVTSQLAATQRQAAISRTGGDPDLAPAVLVRYGCVNCHQIPGMNAPSGNVGPNLQGVGQRSFIAGVLPNSADNLIRWIVDPQSIDPLSAMPKTGITVGEARDVAAYLYSQY